MGRTFRLAVYTPQDLSQIDTMRTLWRVLESPVVSPRVFGSTENSRREFSDGDPLLASEVYADEGMLFVRGARDSFIAMFMRAPGKLRVWNMWWDVKGMAGGGRQSWLD